MLQRSCREIDERRDFFVAPRFFRRWGTFGERPTALIYPPILASSWKYIVTPCTLFGPWIISINTGLMLLTQVRSFVVLLFYFRCCVVNFLESCFVLSKKIGNQDYRTAYVSTSNRTNVTKKLSTWSPRRSSQSCWIENNWLPLVMVISSFVN